MIAIFGRLVKKIGRTFLKAGEMLDPPSPPPPSPPPPPPPPPSPEPTEKELAHRQWVRLNGDKTLRLNYSLGKSDVVLDLGGYEGQWASDIFSKYLCQIHIIEPVSVFAHNIRQRFEHNSNIWVHPIALGASNGEIQISVNGDASSTFKTEESSERAPIVEFGNWMNENNISEIALLKINIEGGEYDLLDHLIKTRLIQKIRDIQVQFHDFIENAEERMAFICERLAATHQPTYQFKFVWENWRRLNN